MKLRLISLAAFFLAIPQSYGAFSDLEEWTGVSIKANEGYAVLPVPGVASFTYPDGEKGWHRVGMASAHDGSGYWRDQYGVRFDLFLPTGETLTADVTLHTTPNQQGSQYIVDTFVSTIGVTGEGWHTITVPLESFSYEKARPLVLEAIKTFSIEAAFADGSAAEVRLRNPHLVKADRISLESAVRSRSAKGGQAVTYELLLTNCTDQPQAVTLSRIVRGREVMETTITPTALTLAPGESQTCEVKVLVSERVAPGGRESQVIQAMANGQDAGRIEYITLGYLEHPNIMHTKERWDAVRQKARDVDWAKVAAKEYIDFADSWVVPEINQGGISSATNCEYIYASGDEKDALQVAAAYQLSGNKTYAEKVALFLRQLADPERGYPRTQQACHKSLVQEGNFFQFTAMAYDMIYNAGILTDEDHANIAASFRIYHRVIDQHITRGDTGNWQVAEICGAIYSALAIQDMVAANRFIEGPSGFYDQLSNGVMADGWWYECSIHYNTWVASEFTQLAFAMQPWGVDFQHASFPATYSQEYNIPYADVEQRKRDVYGKPFQKWGPVHKPDIKIKDMWDALVPYIDFSGVMFATNDSTENKFDRNYYEIGYFAYRDPHYAAIIKNAETRDLLYGVAELPEDTPQLGAGSAYSDNVGVTMLRSNAEGKPYREKIQAVLKYGTHGGYHGHFDRIGLNSLMRYGRSFYNPEHIWYSYPNFMYAFFVQTSIPHNMVVVDMKQQEPVESRRILFSTGDLMQATAVEGDARWSNPPYGGLVYPWFTGDTFQEKCWDEGRYMPVPENEPVYGSIGEYSDRVTQRRLMAVTDEYVLLADYLAAPEEHVFDCLFNIKGFKGIEADRKTLARHTESMDPNPVLAAQLITDCNWYDTEGTTKVSFETQFGEDADNDGTRIHGLDGVLKMDVYSAWPKQREVMIGTLPEAHGVNRKFWYTVKGDDQVLAEGKFGAWILGRDEIDVSLDGIETLTLTTKADFNKTAKKTLFWGHPVIVTADGKELKLSDLKLAYDRIDHTPASGQDYYGGPVKLSGRPFAQTVPANPLQPNEDGTITLDLTGFNAARFLASVGGDYPLGDETWRRKSLSFRTTGTTTRYLTVIEPYEDKNMVKSVIANSANELTVELVDGRKHIITLQGLEEGRDLKATIQEFKNGKLIREEQSNENES